MNTTSPLALAAAAVLAMSQSSQAGPHGGGGGHFGFNGSAAPAVHAPAPAVRAPVASAPVRSFAPTQRSFARTSPAMNYRAPVNFNSNVRRSTPSFAFGGHAVNPSANYYNRAAVVNNVAVANQNARFAQQRNLQNQQLNRQAGIASRYRYAPATVSRDWDHRRNHSWNNHNYRWFGNSWVIADSYPYAYYPGYYDGGAAYPDVDSDYDTSSVESNAPGYGNGDTLGSEVQQALADQGYYRGEIDGDVGPNTQGAIAAFQRDHQMPVTGRIDLRLLNSLGLD